MGIKFNCPNGHKIHVKAFLAGKRGICPQCGVRVDIPAAGEVAGGRGQEFGAGEDVETDSSALVQPVATELPFDPPAAVATVAVRSTPAAPALPPVVPAATVADPIADAPSAGWWVRPRSGGQFGPAPGTMLRQWIAENRVAADSLVWREGWPQWKSAAEVFPDFSAAIPMVAAPALPVNGSGAFGDVRAAPPAATSATAAAPAPPEDAYTRFRRRRRQRAIAMIVLLAIAAAALVGVLIWQWATR